MICPKCHTINDDEEKYCRNCGFQLNSSRICPECGKANDSNSKYCKECGTVLTPVNTFRKQIIEENTKKSFFSLYKVPIICALLIILAIGGVAGMAFYNGNSGGDDSFNSFIPSDNNSGGFFLDDSTDEPVQAMMEKNETNQTKNDTNKSKTITEKVENKTNDTSKSLSEKVENKTKKTDDTSKSLTEKAESKVNQTKKSADKTKSKAEDKSKSLTDNSESKAKANQTEANSADKSKSPDGSKSLSSDSSSDSKTLTEKVKKSEDKTDDTSSDDDDDIIGSDDSNDDSSDDSSNSSASSILGLNDQDSDENGTDSSDDDSKREIEMSDVPNLAQKVSERDYSFSTIEYDGNEYSKAQCIYIFAEYILNVDKGKTSAIEFEDFDDASSPSGDDESQSIDKADYLSIADRVHSWMDSHGSVPNYVGISVQGQEDLSPDKMLELFALATLDYSISEELPDSVQI